MYRILPALLVAGLLFSACGETEQVSTRIATKADLARLAFDALQADDFELLSPALPTAKGTLWMLETRARNVAAERVQPMRDMLAERGGVKAVAEDAARRIRVSFQAARQLAAEGMDWTDAVFVGLARKPSESLHSEGLELADVFFTFQHDGREEVVQLIHCALVEGGWVLTGGLRYEANPHENVEDARLRLAQMQLRMLQDDIKLYRVKHGKLPADLSALTEPDPRTGDPLVKPELRDPWAQPFRVDVVEGAARVTSAGPDGALDTEDDLVVPVPLVVPAPDEK